MPHSRKFQKQTDEFVVRAEGENEFVVIEYTNYVEVQSMGQPPNVLEGLKEYRTTEGYAVNKLSEDAYEILEPIAGPTRATRV